MQAIVGSNMHDQKSVKYVLNLEKKKSVEERVRNQGASGLRNQIYWNSATKFLADVQKIIERESVCHFCENYLNLLGKT